MLKTLIFFVSIFSILSAEISLSSKIPNIIWQTYKTKNLNTEALETQYSWTSLNPEFSYFLYDDFDIEKYIKKKLVF